MRINSETLIKFANDVVNQRLRTDRALVAIFMTGSVLGDHPLLGDAADIDLFYIHVDEPPQEREIIRLTDDIHVDIAHYSRRAFRLPKEMRLHPWMAHTVNKAKILYDPQHFMDFTQASVRGQFDRPDNVLQRARSLAEQARQQWLTLQFLDPESLGPVDILGYLRAVEQAANTIASLTGAPLAERRLLMDFPQRANAIQHPGAYAGLLGLLGAPHLEAKTLIGWLPDWRSAYLALPAELAPARLHPFRLGYYQRAIEFALQGEQFQVALWPLLNSWTRATTLLVDTAHILPWKQAVEHLGLFGQTFAERVQALDAFLDTLEEILSRWGQEHGA